jgi:hypothetical protein
MTIYDGPGIPEWWFSNNTGLASLWEWWVM